MDDDNKNAIDTKKVLDNVEKLLLDKRIQEVKDKVAGKKVFLCGPGKDGECDSRCIESNINDKCGYHQRKEIQERLRINKNIIGIVLDDSSIGQTDDIIEFEKDVIKKENIDAVVIFPDAPGPQREFTSFMDDPNIQKKIILFVKEKFFPFYGEEGLLTNDIKKFLFKNRGFVIIVKEEGNIYSLVEECLLCFMLFQA